MTTERVDQLTALYDRYLDAVNAGAAAIPAILDECVSPDVRVLSPVVAGEGRAAVAAQLASIADVPDRFVMRRDSALQAHNDRFRVAWAATSPTGRTLAGEHVGRWADGRLTEIVVFVGAPAPLG